MRRTFVLIIVTAFVLGAAAQLPAQQPDPGQHHGAPEKGQPAAPGGTGQGMMGGMGMMGGGMCPMMGGMMPMMGGPTDPKAMGRMLQMRGEMMKAMGEVMMKHGKMMEPGN